MKQVHLIIYLPQLDFAHRRTASNGRQQNSIGHFKRRPALTMQQFMYKYGTVQLCNLLLHSVPSLWKGETETVGWSGEARERDRSKWANETDCDPSRTRLHWNWSRVTCTCLSQCLCVGFLLISNSLKNIRHILELQKGLCTCSLLVYVFYFC